MTDTTDSVIDRVLRKKIHSFELQKYRNLREENYKGVNIEWFNFAISFLTSSKTLINIAKKGTDIYSKMHIIPAMYNFRHAIELSLKLLFKFTDKSDLQRTHDTVDLYERVLSSLEQRRGFKVPEFITIFSKDGITEENVTKIIDEAIADLKSIVTKYYFHSPLTATLNGGDFFIEDKENELFKYPETKNVTFYFKSEVMLNRKEDELASFELDIERMIEIVRIFFALLKPESIKE